MTSVKHENVKQKIITHRCRGNMLLIKFTKNNQLKFIGPTGGTGMSKNFKINKQEEIIFSDNSVFAKYIKLNQDELVLKRKVGKGIFAK